MSNVSYFRRRRRIRASNLVFVGLIAGAFTIGAGANFVNWSGLAHSFSRTDAASCDIKGNISIATGERIFHVPGQHYYSETKISPAYGERWFCSEAQARAAGWRKARR